MNLKFTGILTALAVSAVMAQDVVPAADAAPAPVAETAPAKVEDKFVQAEQELSQENFFSEPTAVRGEEAAKPVAKKAAKKFVYKPVYTPAEVETSGAMVKTVYITEKPTADSIDMDELRGLIPLKFTFGLQGFVGNEFLSGDNDRYEYDRYTGLAWSVGGFALIPLDEYNMAFKTGVLFEHAKVSNSYSDKISDEYHEFRASFSQYRLSLPLLLSLKSAKSNIFFDVGVQPSFALADKFKVKSLDNTGAKKNYLSEDMVKEDYRSALDWSIVIGFGVRANRYIGFDARFSWGLNNQYDDYSNWPTNNLSSKIVSVGATFYAF